MDRKNLIIDVAALAIYLVVANPAFTGIGMHEWLSLGIFVVFLVHCVMHVEWIAETCAGALSHPTLARTGNLVLDALILVAFVAATVSGIMVSGVVLQALGLYATGYFFWDPLHAVSAKVLLALLLVHVALHWKWFAGLLGRKGNGEGK